MKKSISLIVLILILITCMACTETSEKWLKKGFKAFSTENYDEAIKCSQRAIAIDANNARAHWLLGRIYQIKGMVDEAISEYKKTITIDPNNNAFHNALGAVYLTKEMLIEAISEFKKAIDIEPDYAIAHYNLGIAYSKQSQNTLAAKHLHEAGFLYIVQGNREKALKAYRGLEEIKAEKLAQDLYKMLAP